LASSKEAAIRADIIFHFVIVRKKIMILICMIVAGTIGTYIALSYLGILG
jgi:sensor domain CHASE-containing protein